MTTTLPAGRARAVGTPLARARAVLLFVLLASSAVSWAYLGHAHHLHRTPTMGAGVGLFVVLWMAMVAASMFPTAAPMVVMFARVNANRRANGHSWSPTSLFVAGYVLLWAALGLACYLAAVLVEANTPAGAWAGDSVARISGAAILGAGLFQFSRLKDRCLTECRSPLAFIAQHWRDGRLGAVHLGVRHGITCAGCCWALMVMLFPIGMSNIAVMAAVSALIFAERVFPSGANLGRLAGVAMLLAGVAVLLHPGLLPGPSDMGSMHMG